MKRNYLFYWFAVLLLLFSPARSYAEVYSGTCGENVNWSLDTETGLLEITGSGEMKDYSTAGAPWYNCRTNIKECVIENGVTSIGSRAFSGYIGLTSITIPNSVKSIGTQAFYGCTGLTSITIPESVTSIGRSAFKGCTGLTSITLPNSVTSIDYYAFEGCTGLTSITWNAISCTSFSPGTFNGIKKNITSFTFGNKVQTIPAEICSGMRNLTNITIPKSVTSIGADAFWDCIGLTSITIPESVTSIGSGAFCNCIGLTSITIPDGVTSIEYFAFYDCTGLTSITIPNSVTSIGTYAFSGCTGLTSITIPNSVTSIGDNAFYECSGLTSITIPESVTGIGSSAFQYCSQLKTVINCSKLNFTKGSSSYGYVAYYADKVIKADTQIDDFFFEDRTDGNYLIYYIGNETELTLPENYQGGGYNVGESVFSNYSKLTNIIIPESVTSIGSDAFYGCDNLKTVINLSNLNITEGSVDNGYVAYYADKVIKADTQIDDFFFEDRTDGNYLIYYIGNKTELTLPENYQGGSYGIGDYAFYECSGLTNITIPESVTSIESEAFDGCTGLTSFNVDKNNPNYCSQNEVLFTKDMKSIICVPAGKTGDYSIGNSVKSIGNSAFRGCSGLTNITIPNSATSIGDGAFKGCTGLTSITIPENVTSIGIDAFCGCNNLTSIVWNVKSYPDPTSYEESPFYSNIGTIQEITFGEGITSIPIYLCKGMSNLKTVTFPQSLTSIRHYAFEGCTGLTEITLPENVDRIGPNALAGCTNIKTIYCRSQEPPVCGNSALDGIDTWDCTLFVPEGAEALYKAADQWKEFFFIEEITGIDAPKVDKSGNATFDIYDMSGRMVRKGATTTDGLKAGLYIINGRKVLVE